ncbi:MAG: sugar ABC transporter permease [Oscillospiraceae bacterium]|nr:sugar ABC transporter permease [Oscillospiraceae bacterium]
MKARKRSKLNSIPRGFVALCVLPALAGVLLFLIYPTVNAIMMSFTNASSLAAGSWDFVGLDNYIRMFTNDPQFITALQNTVQLLAVVPVVTIFLALVFAYGLTQAKLKEKGVYRVLFFIPNIISLVVVAVVFSALLHPRSTGPINMLIGIIDLDAVPWLGDPTWAIWAITIVMVWQAVGYYMVLHIAAIDGISKDIFEAADIDGASAPAKFFRITVPMLLDNIGITYVLALAGTMSISFILGRIMTNFGPGTATLVLPGHMFNMAFTAASFGYAMAIMAFTLLMALVFAFISRKLTARRASMFGD